MKMSTTRVPSGVSSKKRLALPLAVLFTIFLSLMHPSCSLLLPKKAMMTSGGNHIIDLRSDTLTKPTPAMRKAMNEAEVGDDVFCEDPTVNKLEQRVAGMFQKEAALFFPTGTMANLAAAMVWCGRRGSEAIVGDQSHVYMFEQSNLAQIAGVSPRVLPNRNDGTISMEAMESAIRADNVHFPVTQLIALENTHNMCGGTVLPAGYTDAVKMLAARRGIPVHMDGARIWNAATASGTKLSKLAESVDSLSCCLSKGLGAPAGSLLVASADVVQRARRVRKALGGGMRQVGVLAAAGLIALDDFESGMLEKDHTRAKQIADKLSTIPGLRVNTDAVHSNIVLIHLEYESCDPAGFAAQLKEQGVLVLPFGQRSLRLVTHRDITDEDMITALKAFRDVAARVWTWDSAEVSGSFRLDGIDDINDASSKLTAAAAATAATTEEKNAADSTQTATAVAGTGAEKRGKKVAPPLPQPVYYEEVLVRAMSISDEGFCVFLWGTVCDRCLKVIVTPEDPMSDGLDRDAAETSEAITLLQLFQDIDMETFFKKDALSVKFGEDSKRKYKLKLIQIQEVAGDTGFRAELLGKCRITDESAAIAAATAAAATAAAAANTAAAVGDGDSVLRGELVSDFTDADGKDAISMVFNPNGADYSAASQQQQQQQQQQPDSSIYEDSSAPAVQEKIQGTVKRITEPSAFVTLALAMRHHATIEVRADLLQDESISYSTADLIKYFPELKETTTPIPKLSSQGGLSLTKRLQRRLAEARRQGNAEKMRYIQDLMHDFQIPIPAAAMAESQHSRTLNKDIEHDCDGAKRMKEQIADISSSDISSSSSSSSSSGLLGGPSRRSTAIGMAAQPLEQQQQQQQFNVNDSNSDGAAQPEIGADESDDSTDETDTYISGIEGLFDDDIIF